MISGRKEAPSFKYLKDILYKEAERGGPGFRLPSVRDMRARFSLSQTTVDRALFELESEGVIERAQGRGIFVAERKKSQFSVSARKQAALIVPQIDRSPLFSEIARAVEEEAFNLGYQIILCSSWRQIGRGCKYMETLADDDSVLAVIYVSSGEDDGFLPGLERVSAKKALVVIDAAVKGLVADHVTTDDAVGAFEAVDSLIKSGRRKIAFLTAQRDVSTLNSRFDGYRRALKENGLAFDEGLVITDPNCDPKGGFEAMARALGSGFDADALFCSADSMTEGALKALHEAGVSIPSQLRVIGFGDLKFDNPYKLSLSSVGQPFSEMGVRAMRLADERVRGAGPRGVCRELALPVKLHIRET